LLLCNIREETNNAYNFNISLIRNLQWSSRWRLAVALNHRKLTNQLNMRSIIDWSFSTKDRYALQVDFVLESRVG